MYHLKSHFQNRNKTKTLPKSHTETLFNHSPNPLSLSGMSTTSNSKQPFSSPFPSPRLLFLYITRAFCFIHFSRRQIYINRIYFNANAARSRSMPNFCPARSCRALAGYVYIRTRERESERAFDMILASA